MQLHCHLIKNAQKRGAKIYAEVVGYGATGDAYHMTAPNPDGSGAGKAILQAIEEAGVAPSEVDYINAHGTGTPANDSAETTSIRYALKEAADKVHVSSTKSMNFIPPTINVTEQDEACDLDVTPNVGVATKVEVAISNSLGFGGHNAVICVKKWKD